MITSKGSQTGKHPRPVPLHFTVSHFFTITVVTEMLTNDFNFYKNENEPSTKEPKNMPSYHKPRVLDVFQNLFVCLCLTL